MFKSNTFLVSSAKTAKEAEEIISANADYLAEVANLALVAEGSKDTATVSVGRELFPLREYDTFSLPGGYYNTLRVVIGAGKGHNWWCVLYPGICTPATTEDLSAVAAMAGMDEDTISMITGESPEYIFRFKVLELFEEMMSHIRLILSADS